jgi:hypothetical protein
VKIEVFYVPDCPHHPSAVRQLIEVLSAEGVWTEINEIAVTDAKAAAEYRFRGSPTIRINGRDIAGDGADNGAGEGAGDSESPLPFALACRMYPGAREAGVPPREMMQRAVREARAGEKT